VLLGTFRQNIAFSAVSNAVRFFPSHCHTAMRLELALIPVIFGMAVAVLIAVKPLEVNKPDLSALFLYWPEAYKYAERGDAMFIRGVVPFVTCASSGIVEAPPGLAYKALGLTCRFRP